MAYLVRQELCDVRMLRHSSSLANYVVDPLGKQLLQMSVVCDYGNSHRVRPRVVGDESPLTPQGLCELSLPLEHEGFDWGQAQFGVVQFIGGCVSYVEEIFVYVFGGPRLAAIQQGRHDARMEDVKFNIVRDVVVLSDELYKLQHLRCLYKCMQFRSCREAAIRGHRAT